MNVLVVEPGYLPYEKEINGLSEMQATVGGYIEAIYPYEEMVTIVCNEEGKLIGAPLNRGIYNENGELQDIIAGNFFVCSAPMECESFQSLSEEQIKQYTEKFKYPEMFFRGEDGKIIAKKITAEPREFNAER